MNTNYQNFSRVKKQGKKPKKTPRRERFARRRHGIKLETASDIDPNTWDELCTSLFPSWCKQGRGIILGKKNQETLGWEVKTSLHPNVDRLVFEAIREFFDENSAEKDLDIELCGKRFKAEKIELGSETGKVIWMRDNLNNDGLAIALVEDLIAVFFYELGNEGDINKEKIFSFVDLIEKMT